jgi:hypothetical protein
VILALQRKLPPIRLAFNLAQFLLGGCVTVLVFHAVVGSATDPGVWGAAALATAANSVMAVLLISVAVSLSDVRLTARQIAESLRTDLTMVLATTSLGLCAGTLVYQDWRTAILPAVPVVGMFLMFHAYLTQRQRHHRIEFLYENARALSRSSEIGPAMADLPGLALEAFRAEAAEVVFFSPDGGDALPTTRSPKRRPQRVGADRAGARRRAARAGGAPGEWRRADAGDARRSADRLPSRHARWTRACSP